MRSSHILVSPSRSLTPCGAIAAWCALTLIAATWIGQPLALLKTEEAASTELATVPLRSPARRVAPSAVSRGNGVTLATPEGPGYPYYAQIQAIARKYRIAPELIAGIVRLESGFDRSCVSPVGAVGLMQVMPETARDVARSLGWRHYDLYDPKTNLELGTCYLVTLLRMFHDHLPTALSFYNAGRAGVVSRGVYRNRRYIRLVMNNYWDYVRNQPDAPPQASPLQGSAHR